MLVVEQRHHDQRVVAVAGCARSRAAALPRRSLRCAYSACARVLSAFTSSQKRCACRSRKAICVSSRTQARPEALALGLQHDALELDAAVRVAAALQDDEAGARVAGAGLDDEVAEVREAHRAFVLRALPGRDERQVGGVAARPRCTKSRSDSIVGRSRRLTRRASDIHLDRVAVQLHQLAPRLRLALAHQLGQRLDGRGEAERAEARPAAGAASRGSAWCPTAARRSSRPGP